MMKNLILSIIVISSLATFAQKEKEVLLDTYNDVVEAATKTLDEAMQAPEGELYLFKVENNIKGEYYLDITIHEKGLVASVFCSGNEGGDIKSQNLLKDYIKEYKFNFKMPKGKKYKFSYIFKFE